MSNKSLNLTAPLYDYLLDSSLREPAVMKALRLATAKLPEAIMQIAPDQAQFMSLLIKILGANKALEIGTFTGYSALAVALALPEDGELICCDIHQQWTDIGKHYWQLAGVENKIDLRLAPAMDTLQSLLADQLATQENADFDFVFIDADKVNYLHYYELSLELLRNGGLIAIDNTLWSGDVIDAEKIDVDTVAIREFNRFICNDERVDISMLPVADGLTVARKI